MFFRRAMYETNKEANSEQETKANEEGEEIKLDELDEEEFEGKVTIENWAMTRA